MLCNATVFPPPRRPQSVNETRAARGEREGGGRDWREIERKEKGLKEDRGEGRRGKEGKKGHKDDIRERRGERERERKEGAEERGREGRS